VIDNFMAQTGDPTGTGTGGSRLPNIPAEFSSTSFRRGTVGMARSQMPNSANSQFFITFRDASFLNGQYTVWGEVISGMEYIDQIKRGEPPSNPDKIIRMQLGSSLPTATAQPRPKITPPPTQLTTPQTPPQKSQANDACKKFPDLC
jgi:peptidylprolyl isomerase